MTGALVPTMPPTHPMLVVSFTIIFFMLDSCHWNFRNLIKFIQYITRWKYYFPDTPFLMLPSSNSTAIELWYCSITLDSHKFSDETP